MREIRTLPAGGKEGGGVYMLAAIRWESGSRNRERMENGVNS